MADPLRAAVFASGGGSNFQALVEHEARGWAVAVLVSDREGAGALDRAQRAGLPTAVVTTRDRPAADVASELLGVLDRHGVDLILLAGYLRLVPGEVVDRYRGRILNIHPALLPAFGGKGMYGSRVHEAVIASGVRVTGATVHLVDEQYDRGRILAQWPVPVLVADDPESLARRVLAVEHVLYPRTVDHACEALARGREPLPLDPPGDAFMPGSTEA